jgi:GTPase SAR1 family protein
MNSQNFDSAAVACKVVLIGDSGVGKTSIIARYVKNLFSSDCLPTPGASFASKVMNFHEYDKVIKFDVKIFTQIFLQIFFSTCHNDIIYFRYGTQRDKKNIVV